MKDNTKDFLFEISEIYQKKEDKDFLKNNSVLIDILSELVDNFSPIGWCYFPPNTKIGQKITVPVTDNIDDREEIQNIINKNKKADPKKSNNELFIKITNFLTKKSNELVKDLKLIEQSILEYLNDLKSLNENKNLKFKTKQEQEQYRTELTDQLYLFNDQSKIIMNKINLSIIGLEINECLIDLNDLETKHSLSKSDIENKNETINYLQKVDIEILNNNLLNFDNTYFEDKNFQNKIKQNDNINLFDYSSELIEVLENNLKNNINNGIENSSEIRKLIKKLLNINLVQIENLSQPNNFIKTAIENKPSVNKDQILIEEYPAETYLAIDLNPNIILSLEELNKKNQELIKFLSKEFSLDFKNYKNANIEDCKINDNDIFAINLGEVNEFLLEKTLDLIANNLKIKDCHISVFNNDALIEKLEKNQKDRVFTKIENNERIPEINPRRKNEWTVEQANNWFMLKRIFKIIDTQQSLNQTTLF